MSYTLCSAGPHDAAACAAILREWIGETDWFTSVEPPSAGRPGLEGRIAGGEVVITYFHGHVAGFLALSEDLISCLYVARVHRNRGLGRLLLDRAKADRPARLHLWTFQANTEAQRFYEREGFCAAERTEGENEEGLPDIRYVWSAEGKST